MSLLMFVIIFNIYATSSLTPESRNEEPTARGLRGNCLGWKEQVTKLVGLLLIWQAGSPLPISEYTDIAIPQRQQGSV